MLFRQLEYFVALARERHFARAAAACYVSQPALSAAIAKLEQELNVALIYRDHAFQGLTPEGERLVIWARRILAEHDALKLEVSAMRSSIEGVLRLGVIPSASTTAALPIAAFCAQHPLASVQFSSRQSSASLAQRLRDFELDAAVLHAEPGEHSELEIVPLYRERYHLVCSTALLPAQSTIASWREASELPLALLTTGMQGREVVDAAFRQNGVEPKPQVETDSIAALYALMRSGSWATVVPHAWIHVFGPLREDTLVVPLADPVATAPVVVAINASEPGSPIARAFALAAAGLHLDGLFDGLTPDR